MYTTPECIRKRRTFRSKNNYFLTNLLLIVLFMQFSFMFVSNVTTFISSNVERYELAKSMDSFIIIDDLLD